MSDLEKLIARLRTISTSLMKQAAAAIEQLQAELVQAKQAVDCWFEDAKNLAEFKVTVATGINMTLERYRELVEIMEDRDRITGYLRERNQECADLKTERDALRAELEAVKRKIDELFPVIAHGDDKHRAWLKDAIEKHFDAARARYQNDAVKASILPKADRWYEPR